MNEDLILADSDSSSTETDTRTKIEISYEGSSELTESSGHSAISDSFRNKMNRRHASHEFDGLPFYLKRSLLTISEMTEEERATFVNYIHINIYIYIYIYIYISSSQENNLDNPCMFFKVL